VSLTDIKINGISSDLVIPWTAIIDSGTSNILAPSSLIPSSLFPEVFPCDSESLPILSFVIEGKEYILEGIDYAMPSFLEDGKCQSGVKEGGNEGMIVLGDSFMKNYHTYFDAGRKRIGFARIKQE
jgi:Eukaryotic aspartyl protease